MAITKKLPEAEFEIMRTIWANPDKTNCKDILNEISNKVWKIQTVQTLLGRLVERGFLQTEKHGKDRTYYPLINEEEYLQFEAGDFISHYFNNSLVSLVNTFSSKNQLSEKDLEELKNLIDKSGE
ncbi:MAG: BlaI/MecI/CopY family transcriptional regulator [Saccharofermentanales bacterium]